MSFNASQTRAIHHKNGPMLVLAGPGSGKTLVITERTKYLIEACGIDPAQILVITFTKAAATEMKRRFQRKMNRSCPVTFGTFHAVYFAILKHAYNYSADNIAREEQRYQCMREIIAKEHLTYEDETEFITSLLGEISLVKNSGIEIANYYSKNCAETVFRKVYRQYHEFLYKNRLIDFDDMLVYTKELFEQRADILAAWQNKYRYILIDEFQDINRIQYDIIKMLAGERKNLFIVGDDDQSIYKFRGANIENILSFEHVFPDAKVIKLEQNYRSTQNILNAANEVIANNQGRKAKRLWTENPEGDLIDLRQFQSGFEEAEYVAGEITRGVRTEGKKYRDYAILYRTNAQSRLFEEKLLLANVPYKIVGGVNFYARREIKDLLAYLRVIENPEDDLAVLRIINVPRRGIGAHCFAR